MTDPVPVLAFMRSDPATRRYGGMRLSCDTLQVLQALGHDVRFVATGDSDAVRPSHVDGVDGWIVPASPLRKRLRRGLTYQVAKRLPDDEAFDAVLAEIRRAYGGRAPLLLLEQFPMFAWFDRMQRVLVDSPRVLREHNDEPLYAALVAAHERRRAMLMAVREVKTVVALYHDPHFLESFDAVISISAADDVARYGFSAPVTVIPSFLAAPPAVRPPSTSPSHDFGVFGSLDHGPNAHAIGHLLTSVWPHVVGRRAARLLVAGHAPSRGVTEMVQATPDAELLADPEHRETVYDRCRAMVDPSPAGTGVAVKTLEALTFGRPVIGYVAARRGLPDDLRAYVHACESDDELADALVESSVGTMTVPAAAVHKAADRDSRMLSDALQRVTRAG